MVTSTSTASFCNGLRPGADLPAPPPFNCKKPLNLIEDFGFFLHWPLKENFFPLLRVHPHPPPPPKVYFLVPPLGLACGVTRTKREKDAKVALYDHKEQRVDTVKIFAPFLNECISEVEEEIPFNPILFIINTFSASILKFDKHDNALITCCCMY